MALMQGRTQEPPVWFRRTRGMDYVSVWLSVAGVVLTLLLFTIYGGGASEPFALVITLLGVALSRRRMWTGLLLTLAAVLVAAVTTPPIVEWTVVVFTVFSITLRGVSALRAGTLAAVVTFWALVSSGGTGLMNNAAFTSLITFVAAAATGSAIRSHQQYWYSLEQRTLDAIASREREAERRVAQERLRIARDLHDVVGHEIAAINMYIGAAQVNLPAGASVANQALDSARSAVQSVLRETQHILQVLRTDGEQGNLTPVPDARHVPRLLASFQKMGLMITGTGKLPDIEDAMVSGAVYRLIQEAMTNASRHGDGAVRLAIELKGSELMIDVTNHKHAALRPGAGFGLVGMRERAMSIGGRIYVSQTPETFNLMIRISLENGATT